MSLLTYKEAFLQNAIVHMYIPNMYSEGFYKDTKFHLTFNYSEC